MLSIKNGFYAFEGALHVFSDRGADEEHGLFQWNASDLWRHEYGKMTDGCTFFAEDVFGGQFALRDGCVFAFDPETGDLELIASSIEEWANRLLNEFDSLTGYPLAHAWQQQHGALQAGYRLIPKQPFVLGGEYEIDNLYALGSVKAMKLRASIATQIRDLPDGSTVTLRVTN
jgi:hypothetical protein